MHDSDSSSQGFEDYEEPPKTQAELEEELADEEEASQLPPSPDPSSESEVPLSPASVAADWEKLHASFEQDDKITRQYEKAQRRTKMFDLEAKEKSSKEPDSDPETSEPEHRDNNNTKSRKRKR